MKISLSIGLAITILFIGCVQQYPRMTREEINSILISKPTSTILGDTSVTSTPPPDYVEYKIEPRVVKRVEPKYPEELQGSGLEGNIFVKCWVTKEGNVRRAIILQSDQKYFNRSALEAALQWKFTPARLADSTVVDIWVSVPFRFRVR
jgi:protein TonB